MVVKQVKFRADGEEAYFGGIFVDDGENKYIICGCCGGVYEIDDLTDADITIYENWVDISEEIKGE